MPVEVVELDLGEYFGAVDGVHDLQRAVRVLVLDAFEDEVDVGYLSQDGDEISVNTAKMRSAST